MKGEEPVENVFGGDEMKFCVPEPNSSPEEILATEGIFYLKSLRGPLNLDTGLVLKKVRSVKKEGKRAYDTLGVSKLWGHWIVRMKVFAQFYRTHSLQRLTKIDDDWDGNDLLAKKGIFLLIHVCNYLPISYRQMRYRVHKEPNSRKIYGVWRDNEFNRYLVDMKVFSKWIKEVWLK